MKFTAQDAKKAYAAHFLRPALIRVAGGRTMTQKQRAAYLAAKEAEVNRQLERVRFTEAELTRIAHEPKSES